MTLHHHVHPFGKRVPMFLQVLAPRHGLGHDQQSAGFVWKLVDKVHVDALLGLGLEVSFHCSVGRLYFGVGRCTDPACRLLVDEYILVLIDDRKRRPEKGRRGTGFAVLGLSTTRSAAFGHLLFRQDGHLCSRFEDIRSTGHNLSIDQHFPPLQGIPCPRSRGVSHMGHECFDQLNGMGGLEFVHGAKVRVGLGLAPSPWR